MGKYPSEVTEQIPKEVVLESSVAAFLRYIGQYAFYKANFVFYTFLFFDYAYFIWLH